MATILIAEDDSLLVKMYETKFKKEGYKIIAVTDGSMALEMVKTQEIDLVLLDFMMPKLSGMDFLKEIRADEGLKSLKVIMLSNMNNPVEMEKVKKLGILDFIVKANYTPAQVVERVKKYLK